jgi:hypothetical protein
MSEEVLDIKFRLSKEDDKDIITYNIDGRYEGIFIDKDGKLVGSITGDLTESLKNNTTMLGIYKNYLEQEQKIRQQNKPSISKNMREQASLISKNFPKVYSNGGSKKTKSKRSANANKTLKNRK